MNTQFFLLDGAADILNTWITSVIEQIGSAAEIIIYANKEVWK